MAHRRKNGNGSPSRARAQRLAAVTVKMVTSRMNDLETAVRDNRRELDLQFKRMAQIQQELEELKKISRR